MPDPARIEPIPDDALPPVHVLDALHRGPKIDPCSGRIVGTPESAGLWSGMTVAEVIAERDAFNRACGG